MNPNDVQRLIDKYGQPAFDAAMRQVWVNLITDFVWIGFLLVAAMILWKARKAATAWAETVDSYDKDIAYGGIFAVTRIVPAILMIPCAGLLTDAIQIALNPQWQAIQTLSTLLPGK